MTDRPVLLDSVAAGMTCTGRRNNNEDSLLIQRTGDGYLLAIADGIGGHRAGEVASEIATSVLSTKFRRHYLPSLSGDEIRDLLVESFMSAHTSIEAEAEGEREGMGTTMVAVFIRGEMAVVANTGDSRAYHIRHGRILSRTRDHSVVQSLIDTGQITEEEARHHPLRAMITNCLGNSVLVDTYVHTLLPGDIVLLSSDGFHDYVAEHRIEQPDMDDQPLDTLVPSLIRDALECSRDNVTLIVYRHPVPAKRAFP